MVAGDGGFQMTMPELATIAQEQLDVKVAIINNGYLGMVRQWQEFFYERRYAATPLYSPDFVKIAEAYGLRAGRRSRPVPTSCRPCRRRARTTARRSWNSGSNRKTPSIRWCRPARTCTR